MASKVLHAHPFPIGTVVSAYLREQLVNGGPPTGTATDSSTVAGDMSLTFDGLTEGRRYVAYAGGTQASFFMEEGSLDLLKPIKGSEAQEIREGLSSLESGVLSPRSFTAFANPVQAAVDAATAGEVIELDQDYTLPATLTYSGTAPLKIRGRGDVTIDFSTVPKVGSVRYGLKVSGSIGSALALTADATKGLYAVTLSAPDAATLTAGDWVQLSTTAANYYPYAGGVNVDRGEIKKVFSVSGTTVTFEQAIYDNYAVANTGTLRKINFVENVHIEGVRFQGPNVAADQSRAVQLDYVNGFRVTDCDFDGADIYAVATRSSIRGEIDSNRFRGAYYDGVTGTIFYAVANFNSSQWIRVHDNHAERVRHLWVCSSDGAGQGMWGAPRFITVNANTAMNMEGGASGRSWAFENHGFGSNIVVSNNLVDGCYGGFNTRCGGIKFIGNTIRNYWYYAIEIHPDTVDATDIQIENNTIGGRTLEAGGQSLAAPIYADLTNVVGAMDVTISGNRIEHDSTTNAAIQVVGAVDGTGFEIVRNKIVCTVTPTAYAIQVTPNNVTVEGNRFYQTSFGIRLFGTGASVLKNKMWGQAGAASGDFILAATSGHYIDGNVGRALFQGVRLTAGADSCVVTNNVMDAATDSRAFNFASTLTGIQVSNNRRPATPSTVASATTIAIPVGSRFVVITGTTPITAITAVGHAGEVRVLRFSSSGAQVTDGGNLKLAGNLTTAAVDGTLTLYCDGTNFYELARSAN